MPGGGGGKNRFSVAAQFIIIISSWKSQLKILKFNLDSQTAYDHTTLYPKLHFIYDVQLACLRRSLETPLALVW